MLQQLEEKLTNTELSDNHSKPFCPLGDAMGRFTLNIPLIATQSPGENERGGAWVCLKRVSSSWLIAP